MFAERNKILLFNVQKLETMAESNDRKFVWLLYKWWRDKDIIRRRNDPFTLTEHLSGTSFLTNAEDLFRNAKEAAYMVQYIKLAGRRDLFLYNTYNTITLPLSYYSDLNLENLKRNPLLNIVGDNIHFKFEK